MSRLSPEGYPFPTLPDHLRPGLDLVFVGINPGLYSVREGHYFARPTSRFWPAFSRSRLSLPIRRALGVDLLEPKHDAALLRFGIGFTDVVKRPTSSAQELGGRDYEEWVPRLVNQLERCQPRVACFHGVTAYRPLVRLVFGIRSRDVLLGPRPESEHFGPTRLYVIPNPSPANAHSSLAKQAGWYDRLANFLTTLPDEELRTKGPG